MLSTEAIPFVAASLLAVLGAITSWAVGKRTPDLVRKLDSRFAEAKVPPHLTPDGVGKICIWAADCAQCGVALVSPPLAALLLVKEYTSLLGLVYICLGIIGLLVFLRLLFASPDRYSERTVLGLTGVAVAAIVLNIAMTIVVSVETN